ncbi:tetratricopeptide repeat protein [Flavobacterium sp.]|uniref:type IX secretion system periplasmic lipoprotein PorW/SprE n=1 Tax=Flavobacterium sp. TaxID=239 RepID=UPI0039E461BE
MKTNLLKYTSIAALLVFVIACSTKKNTWLSRNSHALSARDNILFNGGLALDKGVNDLKLQYRDNFWERLPIERMQIKKEAVMPGEQKVVNADFERAETKATKAIQKHSMNIGGSEKNPQMDEAHLMLGKARYYDQRFVPALEAFNYILYKYPSSDKIYEAKIWREKTNMRMDNDALAVTNLNNLLKEIKFKDQIFADANAALSQAYINLEMKDSAVAKLKLARDFTKEKEERARYYFILGQLYEELGYKDSAFASYQSVIDMKRKAARQYVIHAHARQAAQFDYKTGDTLAFVEKYQKMLEDRENRPYLDVLNHQMALFYDKQKKDEQAKKYYNLSLKKRTEDQYLVASNYRNLADIYFNKARYVTAGKYYDSTMVQLDDRSREYKAIKKKRENLNDVIKYEAIATRNDSILKVYAMSETEKIAYYNDHIEKLKKEQEALRLKREKEAAAAAASGESYGTDVPLEGKEGKFKNMANANAAGAEAAEEASKAATKGAVKSPADNPAMPPAPKASGSGESNFYFYNPTTVAFGKAEFKKLWGNRTHKNNWRVSASKGASNPQDGDVADSGGEESGDAKANAEKSDEMFKPEFYIKQLPTTQKEIDSIGKERNFAYYQLGVIYKEKFKEYQLAASKLEKLLENQPEERLVLPSMYNLYKIYEIIDKNKAAAMKDRIIREYPDSRYAQILQNTDASGLALGDTPQQAYEKLFRLYESGDYKKVLTDTGIAIDQFTGEEMVPKFELLKANTIGKLKGVEEYKKALNYVALTYPNSTEGKEAEGLLGREVPYLEALQFNSKQPLSWKILYHADNLSDNKTIALYGKIVKFIKERSFEKINVSIDIYTMDKNFIVIHGMKTEDHAKGIASILKEFKEYKIQEPFYIISNENYRVVQIKKNFDEFLKVGNGPIVAGEPTLAPKPQEEKPAELPKKRPEENQKMKTKSDVSSPDPKTNAVPPGFAPPGSMMPPQEPMQMNQKPKR